MKQETLFIFFAVAFGYLVAGLLIYGTYWATEEATFTIQQTECYDRYGNEIEDLVCDEIVYDSELAEAFATGVFGLMGGLIIILMTLALLIGIGNSLSQSQPKVNKR